MAYTDEELRESLKQLADELGETPSAPQCRSADITPSSQTYCNRFGSWNAALEAAGLPINEEIPSYTDDELIAALREFAKRLGETPTYTQLTEEPELPSARVYANRFDSWNEALEEAGLDENEETLSDEQLLTVLQECAVERGHTPSIPEINNCTDLPSATTYERRFDSWNGALREAGLTPNREVDRYDGTDEELLEMLHEFAAEHDASPAKNDVDFVPNLPHSGVFISRFGSWNTAKQEAGLDTTHQPNRYTDRELLQELQRVAHEQQKSPTIAEMNNADAPSSSTYATRFGSWTAALEEAGLAESHQSPTQ